MDSDAPRPPSRERPRPGWWAPIRAPRLSLSPEGPAYLTEQIVDHYRDSLDTRRMPAVKVD